MDENLNNNGNVQIPVPEKNDYPAQEQQTSAAPQYRLSQIIPNRRYRDISHNRM